MNRAKIVGAGALALVVTLGSASVAMSRADAPAPAPMGVTAAAGAFKVDGVHSSVVYRVKHQDVAYFYGRFNKVEGTFNVDAADAGKNSVEVTIPVDSIDSGNGNRDKHLKSQDFFSAAEFPTITFKSKGWKPTAKVDGEQAFEVVGDLTLLGKTKEVVAQVRHTGSGTGRGGVEIAGVEAKFTIKRSDFGMNFMVGKGLGDEVTVMVGLEGAKQ